MASRWRSHILSDLDHENRRTMGTRRGRTSPAAREVSAVGPGRAGQAGKREHSGGIRSGRPCQRRPAALAVAGGCSPSATEAGFLRGLESHGFSVRLPDRADECILTIDVESVIWDLLVGEDGYVEWESRLRAASQG